MKETNLIKTAIKEIKGLEKETMIYLFGLSIVCFFLDVFLIRYLIHNVYILNLYRSIYIVVGFLSHVYLLNRFFKNKRIKTELKDKENIIIDSLRHLNGTPHELMYKLSNGELNIDIKLVKSKKYGRCLLAILRK